MKFGFRLFGFLTIEFDFFDLDLSDGDIKLGIRFAWK